MKITDVKIFETQGEHGNWLFVKLYTNTGLTGVARRRAIALATATLEPFLKLTGRKVGSALVFSEPDVLRQEDRSV